MSLSRALIHNKCWLGANTVAKQMDPFQIVDSVDAASHRQCAADVFAVVDAACEQDDPMGIVNAVQRRRGGTFGARSTALGKFARSKRTIRFLQAALGRGKTHRL